QVLLTGAAHRSDVRGGGAVSEEYVGRSGVPRPRPLSLASDATPLRDLMLPFQYLEHRTWAVGSERYLPSQPTDDARASNYRRDRGHGIRRDACANRDGHRWERLS